MGDAAACKALIEKLGLQPHPEGGYYRETFRSDLCVPFRGGMRSAATSIYYLLAQGAYSAWHRIDADETWYFHQGSTAIQLHILSPDGGLATHRLGDPMAQANAVLQAYVPAGCWFAAELVDPERYALLGCSVSPGFEFSGFELASVDDIQPAADAHGDRILGLLAK